MPALPSETEMVQAMLCKDSRFEGVFFTAVKTTRIFCRPTCPARKPKPENVVFYATAQEALVAGFRPCKRCQPLQVKGDAPEGVRQALALLENHPHQRLTDEKLLAQGVDPVALRRWFQAHHGMTFHTYARAWRMGMALGQLQQGDNIDGAAFDHGYGSLSGFRTALQQHTGKTPSQAREVQVLFFRRILTPLGPMLAMAEERGVVLLEFIDRPILPDELHELRERYGYTPLPGDHPHLDQLEDELQKYFAGERKAFTVPLHLPGTPFQKAVWEVLLQVPYGETRTYGELAQGLGREGAARAVGRANGQNRLSIVVPCHRIIGRDGSLTGYGGGQPRKQQLLDLEKGSRAPEHPAQASLFGG